MKPRTKAVIPGNRVYPANRCVRSFAITLLLINSFSLWAGGVVTNPTEADLRAALVGGGNVSFECDGTIYLADSLMITNAASLTATGRNITLSGSNSVRVLVVNPG